MSATCPHCGNESKDLIRIEAGLRLRMQELNGDVNIPDEVCTNCFREFSASVSQGAKLRAELNARDHNKKVLWKNRVSLVKSARDRMSVKAYAEAAVMYEKYIRTLEISQDQPAGKLDLNVFNTPVLKKELTILASVYWDLVRIYDSNPTYKARTEETAKKLLEVLPYLDSNADLIGRAERFYRIANNTDVLKTFLKEAKKKQGSKCFIATAAYGSDIASEVLLLREFRDQILIKSLVGRAFIHCYYRLSPPVASFLRQHPSYRALTRRLLTPIASRLAAKFNLKSKS